MLPEKSRGIKLLKSSVDKSTKHGHLQCTQTTKMLS